MAGSNDNLRQSAWPASCYLFGEELKCRVLNAGEHIMETDSVDALFSMMAEPDPVIDQDEMDRFVRWQRGETS